MRPSCTRSRSTSTTAPSCDDFVWTQAYVAAARGEADRHASLNMLVDPRRDPRVALCGGLLALGRDAPGEAVAVLSEYVTPGAAARATPTRT